jgi:hypothetical protein
VVAVGSAIVLQVRWWMLAVAALALAGIVAIDSRVAEGPFADQIAVLILIFVMMALALLLYEAWERIRPEQS